MDRQMNPVRPSTLTSGIDPVAHRDDRRPTRHGFNHRNPEWLRPVDGKEIRTRVPQKLFLLRFANRSYKLNKWIPERRLDLLGEILFVHGIDLRGDPEGHAYRTAMAKCRRPIPL